MISIRYFENIAILISIF